MQRFTDKEGNVWCVVVTDRAIEELKTNTDIDLTVLGMPTGEAIEKRMTQDASVVVVSLLPICKSQRRAANIPQDKFSTLVEAVYPTARDALLEALADWAPNVAQRARFRRAARAIRAEASRPKEEPATPAKQAEPERKADPPPKKPDAKKA